MLDRACQLQLLAASTHRKLRLIADADIEAMRAEARVKGIEEGEQHFRSLRRMAWRDEPDLAE
jgi:hypothetical protein